MSQKKIPTWVSVLIAGVIIVGMLAVAVVGGAAFFIYRHVNTTVTEPQDAQVEFKQARSRFAGQKPLIELRHDDEPILHRELVKGDGAEPAGSKRCGCWSTISTRGKIVRVSIPLWVLRMAPSKHFSFLNDSGIELDSDRVKLTLEDLERRGPGLILDQKDGAVPKCSSGLSRLRTPKPRSPSCRLLVSSNCDPRPPERTEPLPFARFHKEMHRFFLAFPLKSCWCQLGVRDTMLRPHRSLTAISDSLGCDDGDGVRGANLSVPRWKRRLYRDLERRGYDYGHRDGLKAGERDARSGRPFSFNRHDEWRDADDGYRRGYGDRDVYRRSFRNGFESGYSDAYNRYGYYGRGPRGSAYPTIRLPDVSDVSEREWSRCAARRLFTGGPKRLSRRRRSRPRRRARSRSVRSGPRETVSRGRSRLQQPLRIARGVPARIPFSIPAGLRRTATAINGGSSRPDCL